MDQSSFKPIVHLLHGCPFCMKLRLFLVEAGLIDRVDIHLYEQDSEELRDVRAALSQQLSKVGFPAAELHPGEYMTESDDLIAWFAKNADIEPANLSTFQDFATGMFIGHLRIFRENMKLKEGDS